MSKKMRDSASRNNEPQNAERTKGGLHSAVKYILGIPVIAVIGLALTYKYHESEDLRNNLYRPLYAELTQIENGIQQNHMEVTFPTATKSGLEEKGEINRL